MRESSFYLRQFHVKDPTGTYPILGSHGSKGEVLELGNLPSIQRWEAGTLCYVAKSKGISLCRSNIVSDV
jgi:hypothetical protein